MLSVLGRRLETRWGNGNFDPQGGQNPGYFQGIPGSPACRRTANRASHSYRSSGRRRRCNPWSGSHRHHRDSPGSPEDRSPRTRWEAPPWKKSKRIHRLYSAKLGRSRPQGIHRCFRVSQPRGSRSLAPRTIDLSTKFISLTSQLPAG